MKKYLTKKNIFIGSFIILYLAVACVSLLHSFAFFGLANNSFMSILLGCCFELGQMCTLASILTSKQTKFVPWFLMILLTIVQILGNVFSSYKYLILNSVEDLKYFKEPIFIWTDLPDDITTVIVTWAIGAILPLVALFMTAMVENVMKEDIDDTPLIDDDDNTENKTEQTVDLNKDENNEQAFSIINLPEKHFNLIDAKNEHIEDEKDEPEDDEEADPIIDEDDEELPEDEKEEQTLEEEQPEIHPVIKKPELTKTSRFLNI